MNSLRFAVSRTLQSLPVLLGISVVAFVLLRLLPGDPATLLIGARGSAEDIEKLRHQLGLDLPLWQQYLGFLRDMAEGSFGQSITFRREVSAVISERLFATLWLVSYSVVLTTLITLPLGVVSAVWRGRWQDNLIKLVFSTTLSMPQVWLGILLLLFLSLRLNLFPVSGFGVGILEHLWHLFLPALTIALGAAALTIRALRSSIIAVQTAEYIDTAYSKGLMPAYVMRRHVLRNALISMVSVLSVHTSWIIGGTVVIESVFAIPGVGQLLVGSIFSRDYAVVQGLTVTFALLVTVISIITDILYAIIDPRVRLA